MTQQRTREEELCGSLVGQTIEEVKVATVQSGALAVLRLSRPGAEDAYVCFDESSFADAASIWRGSA